VKLITGRRRIADAGAAGGFADRDTPFGTDLVVLPGDEVQDRLDACHAFCREELPRWKRRHGGDGRLIELPDDLVESDTVALVYDETDGLGFSANFRAGRAGLRRPGPATAAPLAGTGAVLPVRRQHRTLCCAGWPTATPPAASLVFQRLLKRRHFVDRDGETCSGKPRRIISPDRHGHGSAWSANGWPPSSDAGNHAA
jgi:hypothetical protein